MRKIVRSFTILMMAVAILSVIPTRSYSQSYPSKPITMIVPTPPGSLVDLLARIISDNFTKAWGQKVIIRNVGGAGASIGAAKIAQAKGDGYTLGFVPANLSTHPSLYNISYNVLKDFTPISQVAGASLVFYASNEIPAKTVKEAIALAKASPGKLTYASAGKGSIAHLAGEMFKSMAGVDIVRVPYKKLNLGVLDVVKGRVSMVFVSAAQGMPHVRAGKLKALGITSRIPNPGAPGVQPISTLGLPDYEIRSWFGVVGPAGIPDDIIKKIHAELVKMSQSSEFKAALAKPGLEPIINTPAQFLIALEQEIPKFAEIVKSTKAKK